MTKIHKSEYRVYYEDTDVGGAMYHGNFIRFCEQGRSDLLRDLGLPVSEVTKKHKMAFVVRHLEADYLRMVKLDDLLSVESHVKNMKNTSFVMNQVIKCQNNTVFTMDVTLVCIDLQGKPVRIPEELINKLKDYLEKE